ncbi:MAG: glutathione S-transferase [Gammaproteobacteria bacterium]|nr:MAG: glutathione S-transferase [Gammaproteobacteria bacterium]
MKLFISLTSPFSRKVRIAMREKQLEAEEIVVNPWESSAELLAVNPLSQVPVLVTTDGPIFDSCAIIEYLEDFDGEINLVPLCGSRWPVLRWMRLADGITEACLTCYLENKRPAEQRNDEVKQRQIAKIERALQWTEERMPDAEFLLNERLTMADISLGCALSYLNLRYKKGWRKERPRLARWHRKISQRPSFKATEPVE